MEINKISMLRQTIYYGILHIEAINSTYYLDKIGIYELLLEPVPLLMLKAILFYVKICYFCEKIQVHAKKNILINHMNYMISDTRTFQQFFKSYESCVMITSILSDEDNIYANIIFTRMHEFYNFIIGHSENGIEQLQSTLPFHPTFSLE